MNTVRLTELSVIEARQSDSTISALQTIAIERASLDALYDAMEIGSLAVSFDAVVAAISQCSGRVIATGMGKSGIIARKIAATLTSTGTPSLFVHPAEASHGDLGVVTSGDVVLALTWSGETVELGAIFAYCRRSRTKLVVMTADIESTAARAADLCLELPVVREACPNELAPTSSTTVQAVMGDALALALVKERGFSRDDFFNLHPGGQIGARLTTVSHIMGRGEAVPAVDANSTLFDATFEMSRKRYGCTAIVGSDGRLMGAFTDGDLRRSYAIDNRSAMVVDHMTRPPIFVPPHTSITDALRLMTEKAISMLFVCDAEQRLVGAVHIHDILRTGLT